MRRGSAPTMKDVAQEAGVALGTVSKVFNNGSVGEDYRRRVLAAAERLGYQVNSYARGLKTNRTYTVAVVLPNIINPFFALLAQNLCQALTKRAIGCFCPSLTLIRRLSSGISTWPSRTRWTGSSG